MNPNRLRGAAAISAAVIYLALTGRSREVWGFLRDQALLAGHGPASALIVYGLIMLIGLALVIATAIWYFRNRGED